MNRKHNFTTMMVMITIALTILVLAFNQRGQIVWASYLQEQIQSKQRKISLLRVPDEPFELAQIRFKGAAVRSGGVFRAEGDWFRDIQLEIKNTSNKTMTGLFLEIQFPETKTDSSIMMGHQLLLGQRTARDGKLDGTAISLTSSSTLAVQLSETDCQRIESLLSKRGLSISKLTTVNWRITQIIFLDGSVWVNGIWHIPDSSSPTGYRKMS